MASAQLADFNFAGQRVIDAAGSFFLYSGTTNPAGLDERIALSVDGSPVGYLLPGDRVELPQVASRWVITPVSAALVGSVIVGVGRVATSRTVGSVRVIDSGYEKTLGGAQFSPALRKAADGTRVSVAGVRTTAKALVIKRLQIYSQAAGAPILFYCTGAPTLGYSAGAPNAGTNKLVGGGAPDHARWSALSTGVTPVVGEFPGYVGMNSFQVPAGVFTDYPLTTPIVVPAGYWLGVAGVAINNEIGFFVDAEEL